MTDDTAFDRERIAKLKERAHKAHGDDASYRTAWLQYHSALQAAFERGTLVFVAQPKPDDDLADRLRVILPKVTPDWMLDGRTVYSLRRGENSWLWLATEVGRDCHQSLQQSDSCIKADSSWKSAAPPGQAAGLSRRWCRSSGPRSR